LRCCLFGIGLNTFGGRLSHRRDPAGGLLGQWPYPVCGVMNEGSHPVGGVMDPWSDPVGGIVDSWSDPVSGIVDQWADPVSGAPHRGFDAVSGLMNDRPHLPRGAGDEILCGQASALLLALLATHVPSGFRSDVLRCPEHSAASSLDSAELSAIARSSA
jgi:hypothetical protein